MKILDIKDNQVIISPEVLEIPEFKKIWELDKSKTKSNAFNDFKYIKYIADTDSPFSNMPENKKIEQVLLIVYNNSKHKISLEVTSAIQRYKELNETALQRLLRAAENKMDDIADYLNSTPFMDETSKTINDIYKNISSYVAQMEKLKTSVEKEKGNTSDKRRGGRDTNLFEE